MAATKPVLFIVDGAVDITGALVSAARQAKLSKDKVDTVIVLSAQFGMPTSVSESFYKEVRLPLVSLKKSLPDLLVYVPSLFVSAIRLKREMKRHHCTRLQLNDFNLVQGAIVRLLGFRGRIVTWIRIDPKRYGIIGRIWLALAKWSSDELVIVSKFIAGQLPPHFRPILIYDAVPSVSAAPRAESRQLLFVGNYIEGKGQDLAIGAFHRIAAQFPEAQLVFHGSDMGLAKNADYRDGLERLAQDGAGNGRIQLRGFVEESGSVYRNAFAALNFSHSESFSLTCLEASAHGLAVVATRCGGPEEIVDDGVSGFLVAVGDVDAMATRMVDLLSDPERTAAMGEAGRQLVNERFSIARFRQQLLEIFDLN